MSQSDTPARSIQDPSATTASKQDQDETLAAPSTTNAAGEQPAAPARADLNQRSSPNEASPPQPMTGGSED